MCYTADNPFRGYHSYPVGYSWVRAYNLLWPGPLVRSAFRVNLGVYTTLNTIQELDPDQEEVYELPLIITRQTLCFCRPQDSSISISSVQRRNAKPLCRGSLRAVCSKHNSYGVYGLYSC